MRFGALILFVSFGLCAYSPSGLAQTSSRLDSFEVNLWSGDLDFLARQMPAKHANLFHAIRREQFDSAIAAIRNRLPSLRRSQVIVELMHLAALIGDGHTSLSPWRDSVVGFHTLPIALYRFSGGYYVRAANREQASLLGARVVRIGTVSVDSAEALVAPLISKDNAMGVWAYAPVLFTMPELLNALGVTRDTGSADFVFDVDGVPRTVTLHAAGPFPTVGGDADKSWNERTGWVDLRDRSPAPLWLSRTNETYWFTYIPSAQILYCQLNEIQERGESLARFIARAIAAADSAGARRFVLDLRLNGGGNGYYNRVIVRAIVRSRFDEHGRLFVITSRRTFSAAQMLISDLENWTNPIFVGEPSESRGNHYGDSRRLVLPNHGVTVRVSTLWWQYWDPRDTRPWIVPQIAAPLTVDAYEAGRDPALEAIARLEPRPSPSERLGPLLVASDSATAWTMLDSLRHDPVNAWVDFGALLADMSAELRAEDRAKAADLAGRLGSRLPAWSLPR